jgi:hypothetical protein
MELSSRNPRKMPKNTRFGDGNINHRLVLPFDPRTPDLLDESLAAKKMSKSV